MTGNGNSTSTTSTAKYFSTDDDGDDDDDCGAVVGDTVGAFASTIVNVSVADTPLNTDDDPAADDSTWRLVSKSPDLIEDSSDEYIVSLTEVGDPVAATWFIIV